MAIIGMAHQGTPADREAFVERHGLGHVRHGVDTDGSLWAHFGVVAQPNWAFVTASGAVETVFGVLSDDQLERRIRAITG